MRKAALLLPVVAILLAGSVLLAGVGSSLATTVPDTQQTTASAQESQKALPPDAGWLETAGKTGLGKATSPKDPPPKPRR